MKYTPPETRAWATNEHEESRSHEGSLETLVPRMENTNSETIRIEILRHTIYHMDSAGVDVDQPGTVG